MSKNLPASGKVLTTSNDKLFYLMNRIIELEEQMQNYVDDFLLGGDTHVPTLRNQFLTSEEKVEYSQITDEEKSRRFLLRKIMPDREIEKAKQAAKLFREATKLKAKDETEALKKLEQAI